MQKDFIKGVETFNKTVLESMKRLAEINAKAVERTTECQLALAADYMDVAVKQMGMFGDMKDMQAAVAAQSKLASEFGEKLVTHAKNSAEVFEATKGEYTVWFEEGIKQASENPLTKPVAVSTKKAA